MNKEDYPESLTGFYLPRGKGADSYIVEVKVSQAVHDQLQKVEVGGKLYVKRAKTIKEGKPVAFLEYRTAEELERLRGLFDEARKNGRETINKPDEDSL